jgi:hypothetical protein
MRQCPTRSNGTHSLIAHWITPSACVERQRRNYHKCFTCRYQGLNASAVLSPLAKPVPLPRLAPAAMVAGIAEGLGVSKTA